MNSGLPPVASSSQADGMVRLKLDIDPGLPCFEGHFPGQPILAGVVQLHWAIQLGRQYFDLPEAPHEIVRLKFKNVIIPPLAVELELSNPKPGQLKFVFTSANSEHSQGTVKFPDSPL